jgi:topoisomerase-4 subunit B
LNEKQDAMNKLGGKPEITRFKGLGEISPDEFKAFIGKKMRIDPVTLSGENSLHGLLDYYMGKNTPERQDFIIRNLRIEDELDPVSEESSVDDLIEA